MSMSRPPTGSKAKQVSESFRYPQSFRPEHFPREMEMEREKEQEFEWLKAQKIEITVIFWLQRNSNFSFLLLLIRIAGFMMVLPLTGHFQARII
ncbi:hypothetical protein NC651_033526 [Populus alba x Populus x berolinensis]|nr:hypothetical protein NC651_033526 [Populus alba x Populus x berolinensis]